MEYEGTWRDWMNKKYIFQKEKNDIPWVHAIVTIW
jgi:hypothetical protein